jgi:hypothetical protein
MFDLYSLVAQMASSPHPEGKVLIQQTAWCEIKKRPFLMFWQWFAAIYGAISIIRHHRTTIMYG